MSRATTLERVERAMAAGDYAQARDRLQGLLATFPDDLEVRSRLGEAYWKLGNPTMAGRYWYLMDGESEELAQAKQAFERSCGGSAERMLQMLKFRADPEAIEDAYAARTIGALRERAEAERPQPTDEELARLREWRRKSTLAFYSCAVIAGAALLLFVIGIIFVLSRYL